MNRFLYSYFVLFLSIAFWSCSDDIYDEKDVSGSKTIEQVKKDILGVWDCSFNEIVIIDSDSMTFFSEYDKSEIREKIVYNIFHIDSLSTRRPQFIEEKYKFSKHELVFFNKDSVLIKQFVPVFFGTTGFEDITLVRKKNL